MANIGDVLPTQSVGYTRYNFDNTAISYVGPGWYATAGEMVNSTTSGISIKFNFTGEEVRVIASYGPNRANSSLFIDGVKVADATCRMATASGSVLIYRVAGLSSGRHYASIELSEAIGWFLTLGSIEVLAGNSISAFDTNIANIKSSVSSMSVGDRIPFRYIATANAFGVIDQLGTAMGTEIPYTSSATPDGTAYFIHTGYDTLGRMKLVADRNIQHSISWDTLNTAGVASGSGLPITIDSKDGFTVRLMSGGVSSTDKDNEWDKIIVESTLNGTIIAGDNAVWGITTISSVTSTRSASNGNPSWRGYGSASWHGVTANTAYINYDGGFRPVLLVDLRSTCTITKVTPTHLYKTQHTECIIEASAALDGATKDFSVLVNGVEVSPLGSSTSRSLPITSFSTGANSITVRADDGGATSTNVIVEAPYRLSTTRTMLPIDGGYVVNNVVLDGTAKLTVSTVTNMTVLAGNKYSMIIPANISKIEVKF